jgi:hypothetical protein
VQEWSISVVVTAPFGIAACDYMDDLLSRADGQGLEIVVVDGASKYADQSRVGLRHVAAPRSGLQGLIAEGIRQSSREWTVVTEDHCRPLTGFLEGYRDAVRENPDIDLFSGAVENLTSTSPWSFAVFMIGLRPFWTKATLPPSGASNANLMVRRSAILESELASDGGLLNLTVPRLIRSGRYKHCPNAAVDHILNLSWSEAFKFQFNCTASVVAVKRETLPTQRGPTRIVDICRDVVYHAAVVPFRVVRQFRGTSQSSPAAALRLVLLGLAAGIATITVDFGRLVHRAMQPARLKNKL